MCIDQIITQQQVLPGGEYRTVPYGDTDAVLHPFPLIFHRLPSVGVTTDDELEVEALREIFHSLERGAHGFAVVAVAQRIIEDYQD